MKGEGRECMINWSREFMVDKRRESREFMLLHNNWRRESRVLNDK
jgi:hypothetical protein